MILIDHVEILSICIVESDRFHKLLPFRNLFTVLASYTWEDFVTFVSYHDD
jgi:hypothetical protein